MAPELFKLFVENSLAVDEVGEKEQALALFNVGGRSGGAPSPAKSSLSLPLSLLPSSLGWWGGLARFEETHSYALLPLGPWSKLRSLLLRAGCYKNYYVRRGGWRCAKEHVKWIGPDKQSGGGLDALLAPDFSVAVCGERGQHNNLFEFSSSYVARKSFLGRRALCIP